MQGVMSIPALKFLLLVVVFATCVVTLDLYHSDIMVVTNETRYRVLNPTANLQPFNKVRYVKGNFVFSLGERISGDRLILTNMDETQFTKSVDVEVLLRYPEVGSGTAILTYIEIYANLSSDDADAFIIDGGIDKKYAEILLTCNSTLTYSYQTFFYGF